MNQAPCKDCPKRAITCHSVCPLYKQWKTERKEAEKVIFEARSRSYDCENRQEKRRWR